MKTSELAAVAALRSRHVGFNVRVDNKTNDRQNWPLTLDQPFFLMKLPIHPYVGAGPIRLGMTRDQVRAVVAQPYKEFWKSLESKVPTDAFDSEGIHVYYKPPGVCEAVEFAGPAMPTLDDVELINKSYKEAATFIKRRDPNVSEDGSGLTALGLGVGLYADGVNKNPDLPVEGVIVFERGYYD